MSFWARPGRQVLPGLTHYLYLDRFSFVVRGRGFSGEASSVLTVLCARPLMWRHGSDIARETGLKSGTLYLILIRLADRGWLEACWEDEQPAGRPRRHLYRLTGYHPLHAGPSAGAGDGVQVHPVLASDLEREQTLQAISHAVGEGRLNLGEAERRIEAVLHSRHRHELAGLVVDLPQPALSEPGKRGGSSPLRLGLLAVAAITILAAVVVQALAGLWELWPTAVAGCGLWAARLRR
jgi:PadR family transcriptional regulator, regulatory protein PadR